MLKASHTLSLVEAGLDEAGRGSLAGPVVAAAVILPKDYFHKQLNDSKQLSARVREKLRQEIMKEAIEWSVAQVSHETIDEINILNASFLAMHKALDQLKTKPKLLLVDGNRFKKYKAIPHECIVKGDATYFSIAAASVLAKTHRDDIMTLLSKEYPIYEWDKNMGYGTEKHREAILKHGSSPYHRKSFNLTDFQLKLF